MSEDGQSRNTARADYLGVIVGVGGCALPEHSDHTAAARVGEGGHLSYICERVPKPLSLAEVYATKRCAAVGALGTDETKRGAVERLSPVLASRWQERLDYECGLLHGRPLVLTPPPGGLGAAASAVLEHMQMFLRICDARWDDTFAWARRFSMAYCGLRNSPARRGVEELRDKGVIEVVEKAGRRRAYYVYRLSAATLGAIAECGGAREAA